MTNQHQNPSSRGPQGRGDLVTQAAPASKAMPLAERRPRSCLRWLTGFALTALLSGFAVLASADDDVRRSDLVKAGSDLPVTLLGHPIAVGEKAPDFTLIDSEMNPVSLHDYAGKVVIITSFPSIDTRVCATQTREFNKRAAAIPGVQILAVSADLPFALNRFCAAEGIDKVRTLSDHREMDYARKYGYWIEEMRLLARGTVIVDRLGTVRYVEVVPKLGQEPDYEAAISEATRLAASDSGR